MQVTSDLSFVSLTHRHLLLQIPFHLGDDPFVTHLKTRSWRAPTGFLFYKVFLISFSVLPCNINFRSILRRSQENSAGVLVGIMLHGTGRLHGDPRPRSNPQAWFIPPTSGFISVCFFHQCFIVSILWNLPILSGFIPKNFTILCDCTRGCRIPVSNGRGSNEEIHFVCIDTVTLLNSF